MSYIFIYNDKGTDQFSLNELKTCLKTIYPDYSVKLVNSSEVKNGILFDYKVKLFCIGGGRDLGYLEMLGDQGCECIRDYVKVGGYYLGICAGAYFASDYIEFDLNGKLEVKGNRKLKFFQGKCVGPLNETFKYNSEDDAIAIEIEILSNSCQNRNQYHYLNGGCTFISYEQDTNDNYKVIAKYKSKSPNYPAIVKCNFGRGKCLLSGIHIEYDPDNLNSSNDNIGNQIIDKLKQNEKYSLLKLLLEE